MAMTQDEMNQLADLLAKCDSEERRQLTTLLVMKELEQHRVPWVMHTLDQPDGSPMAAFIGSNHPDVIRRLEQLSDQLGDDQQRACGRQVGHP